MVHSHNLTNALLIAYILIISSYFGYTLHKFEKINERFIDILTLPGISRGVGKSQSPSVVLTDLGKDILKYEKDFTNALFEVYKGNPKIKPECAYREIVNIIEVKRINEILVNHDLTCQELLFLVVSFSGGVKYHNYLKDPPDFLKD